MSMPTFPTSSHDGSFHCFTHLPPEIRVKVWHFALPGPRVVVLRKQLLSEQRYNRIWSDCANDARGNERFREEVDFPVPRKQLHAFRPYKHRINLLHVCRESYAVASQVYKRTFGTAEAFPETWFDFERDTLCLDYGESSSKDSDAEALYGMSDDIKKVERLAMIDNGMDTSGSPDHRIGATLEHLGGVKRLECAVSQLQYADEEATSMSGHRSVLDTIQLLKNHKAKFSLKLEKSLNVLEWGGVCTMDKKDIDCELRCYRGGIHGTGDRPLLFEMPDINLTTLATPDSKAQYARLMTDYLKSRRAYYHPNDDMGALEINVHYSSIVEQMF